MITNKKFRMTLKDWVICYVGALGFGGLAWWGTGNQWAGFGVIVIFTASYVLVMKSRKASAEAAAPVSTEGMTRQQRRAIERKKKI